MRALLGPLWSKVPPLTYKAEPAWTYAAFDAILSG
jgi:hypothetical protein